MFRNRRFRSKCVKNSIHVDIVCMDGGAWLLSPKKICETVSFGLILSLLGMMGLTGCSLSEPCALDRGQFLSSEGCGECPIDKGYHYHWDGEKHFCVVDSAQICGQQETNCTDMKNVKEAACDKGQCVILNCKDSYEKATRSNNEVYCRSAAVEQCGDHATNCREIKGVKDAKCIAGECLVTECDEGYNPAVNKDGVSYCMGTTATDCGEYAENCTEIPNVGEVECDAGIKCKVLTCQDGFDLKNNSCIENNVSNCGETKENCWKLFEGWYSDKKYKEVATPICQEGTSCAFVCGSYMYNNEVYNSTLISCRDYLKNPEEYGIEFASNCNDKDDFEFCLPYQCPRPDAGKIQKVMPGVCGCGVSEDTDDSDLDGVINCRDDCPNNPTKYALDEGDVCAERDTDGDGINDKDDICPTRKNSEIKAIISSLTGQKMCDNEGRVLAPLDNLEKAKLCGVYIEKSNSIDEFHIYNALDLEALKSVLRSINNKLYCKGHNNSKCSTENIGNKCIDGIYYPYKYSASGTTSASQICFNDTDNRTNNDPQPNVVEALEFSQLKVMLENNINLNDNTETIIKKDLNGDMQCSGMWAADFDFIGVDFDGKGHTIRYYPNDDTSTSLRCDLINSLFGDITLSRIHDIKLDFGVKFYGRGLLARRISSSTLDNIEIKNGMVDTSVIGDEGVGLLAGSYDTNKTIPGRISIFTSGMLHPAIQNIKADHVSVIAPLADSVGGVFGQFSAYDDFNLSLNDYIVEQVQGHNYVGGLFGYTHDFSFKELNVYCDNSGKVNSCINSVDGSNYVGGVIGYFYNSSYEKILIDCKTSDKEAKFCINSVHGNDFVGGFSNIFVAGASKPGGAHEQTTMSLNDLVLHKVHEVKGINYVGGLSGYIGAVSGELSSIKVGDFDIEVGDVSGHDYIGGAFGFVDNQTKNNGKVNLNVLSHSIVGHDYVGGFAGYCQSPFSRGIIRSLSDNIIGNSSVGGVYGILGVVSSGYTDYTMENMYNKHGSISGNYGVGGLIGSMDIHAESIIMQYIYNDVSTIEAVGENPFVFGGLIGEMFINSASFGNISELGVSLSFVYNHIGSYKPGDRAGGAIGSLHEEANPSNTFQKANISSQYYHSEIDAYHVYPNAKENGGFLAKKEGNSVDASNSSIFINYLLSNSSTNYGVLFKDEGSVKDKFTATYYSWAFSVKRTDTDLTSCNNTLVPICSKNGLNYSSLCLVGQLNDTNHTCRYNTSKTSGVNWHDSSFTLGGVDKSMKSLRQIVMDALAHAGVLPDSSD